jgi:hypothetical protein
MDKYIRSRDTLFLLHPQLWLRANGLSPLQSRFLRRLKHYCPPDIARQSMRAGGATEKLVHLNSFKMLDIGLQPHLRDISKKM